MPELPEVETIVRRLQTVLPGKTVLSVDQLHPKTWQGDVAAVIGQEIQRIERRAKIMRIVLANEVSLLIHLKMTGQLIFVDATQRLGGGHPTADWVNELPGKHTRTMIGLSKNATLYFNDQRLFGWIKVSSAEEVTRLFAALGPDVTDLVVSAEYLAEQLKRRGIPIKAAIMDNSIICGVGNIYACDALNLAQIDPRRPAKSLSMGEVERLWLAIKQVITQGIELGGTTTDGKYVDIYGFAGGYQAVMRTYDRAGQACLNCGQPIHKMQIAGRGTYWCPHCQR